MAKNKGSSKDPTPSLRPTITLPPRPSMESFSTSGLGASRGPLTLVSGFFSDGSMASPNCPSFSQLLAGAMGSPMGMSYFDSNSSQNFTSNDGSGSENNLGFKQKRPVNLAVPLSPMFTIPPGFSPSGLLNSPGFFPPSSPFGISHQQALAQVTAQAALVHSHMHMEPEYQPSSVPAPTESLPHHASNNRDESSQHSKVLSISAPKNSTLESAEFSHSDRKYQPSSQSCDRPADDGYNWRKYGQKQVKGSEYPWSYYKCTHPNCPVKKTVEFSSNGQITEIIYKGKHNHEMPQPNRRGKDGSDPNGHTISQVKPEPGSHSHIGNLSESSETVPVNLVPEKDQECAQAAPIQIPGSSDSEELGDTETREDRDGNEPNAKRRNIDAGTSGVPLSHRTVTESKIILQTRSEVDLLDDGYRWRKYGQKVVKGNPHPRSYYKCTTAGCNVRKHVERASTDPKAVITTYEGKHNHEVPAARNSSHNTAIVNNAPQIKPHKVVAQKHPLLKEMDFQSNDQQPVVLRLKEEQITA